MTLDQYNKLLTDYLVDCCLYYELDCTRRSDKEFDENARKIYENFEAITHPHKRLIDKESLGRSSSGFYIKYPSIIRSVACTEAAKIPGSPMYNKPQMDINHYVVAMMNK